jgi:hypothetical protein
MPASLPQFGQRQQPAVGSDHLDRHVVGSGVEEHRDLRGDALGRRPTSPGSPLRNAALQAELRTPILPSRPSGAMTALPPGARSPPAGITPPSWPGWPEGRARLCRVRGIPLPVGSKPTHISVTCHVLCQRRNPRQSPRRPAAAARPSRHRPMGARKTSLACGSRLVAAGLPGQAPPATGVLPALRGQPQPVPPAETVATVAKARCGVSREAPVFRRSAGSGIGLPRAALQSVLVTCHCPPRAGNCWSTAP